MTDKESNAESGVTLYEDELYGEPEDAEPMRHLVIFGLGDEWYGVDVANVKEVVPLMAFTPLPNVADHILGIFNLRGTVISATDLKTFFRLPKEEGKIGERVVVVGHKGISTGLLVDGQEETIEIPLSKIGAPVATLEGERGNLIEGQASMDGKLIAILNVERLIEKTRLQ